MVLSIAGSTIIFLGDVRQMTLVTNNKVCEKFEMHINMMRAPGPVT